MDEDRAPTPAEEVARAVLRESISKNKHEVQLAGETITLLTAGIREEVSDAVAAGIARAMSDENAERFWAKGLEVLQRQATERTGRFVLSGLTHALKKALWVGMLVLAIYSVGGWSLVKTIWIAITKGGA